MFELPKLQFSFDALNPFVSKETMEFHYDKHHRSYVEKLNKLLVNHPLKNESLENIIRKSEGALFNNAAQHWNHSFFWNCLCQNTQEVIDGDLLQLMENTWGNFEQFKAQFESSALSNFGSGWTWLVAKKNGHLDIVSTANADNPLLKDQRPLLVIDVWEHAYYIDYRNQRKKYLQAFWQKVNWQEVKTRLNKNS